MDGGGGGGGSAAPPPDSRQAGSVPAPPGEQQRAAPQPAAEHCKDALARTYAPDGGPARANPQPQPSHQRDSSSACRRDHRGMAVGSGATAASHSCGGRGVLRARDMHFSSFRAMQRARARQAVCRARSPPPALVKCPPRSSRPSSAARRRSATRCRAARRARAARCVRSSPRVGHCVAVHPYAALARKEAMRCAGVRGNGNRGSRVGSQRAACGRTHSGGAAERRREQAGRAGGGWHLAWRV